jgi:hypothetical protein
MLSRAAMSTCQGIDHRRSATKHMPVLLGGELGLSINYTVGLDEVLDMSFCIFFCISEEQFGRKPYLRPTRCIIPRRLFHPAHP